MSHVLKVVSLAATALLLAGGIALAAPPDPTKQISPSQPSQTTTILQGPDLVPKKGWSTEVGITHFSCTHVLSHKYYALSVGALIFNHGHAEVNKPFKIQGKTNGTNWGESPITVNAWLPPGGSTEVVHVEVVGPGTYNAWLKADSENVIAEGNENNNVATATTTCSGP